MSEKSLGRVTRALIVAPVRYQPGASAFKTLGVTPESTTAEIQRAYLRLARRYHPDLNHSPEAAAHLQRGHPVL